MPIVQQPVRITFRFRDRARIATSAFHMGQALGAYPTADALGSYLSEFYANIQDVSDCAGVGYSITYSYLETPFVADYATGNPNAERKGVLSFNLTGSTSKSIFTIPGINIGAQAPDGKSLAYTVDGAGEPTFTGPIAGDMQSIHDKLRNGATVGAVTFPVTDADGNDFSQMFAAYQQTRSSQGRG